MNNNMEHNQNMPFDNSSVESMNNNLLTMANKNFIDLSNHSPQAYDLTMSEANKRIAPINNRVIRTRGAKKIIIDNTGFSYQSSSSEIPNEPINYALELRRQQIANNIPVSEVPRGEYNIDGHTLNPIAYENITDESQNGDGNTSSDEVDHYLPLDDSLKAKIKKHSDMNKRIIKQMLGHLTMIMFPTLIKAVQRYTDLTQGSGIIDDITFQSLIYWAMATIVAKRQTYMKTTSSDQSTQTEKDIEPPRVFASKSTQTDSTSVPRVKINTCSNKVYEIEEPSHEQTALYFHNVASNQNRNVYSNQQEQFYENQQLFQRVPMDESYVVQTPESNRNNLQLPIMQYGMPQTNAMMQRTESCNYGVQTMQAVNQYGIPHTQTANTMMQKPERAMGGKQIQQTGIPQHDPTVIPQRPDICRNRMQTMMQAYHHANATVTAATNPTYYNRPKTGKVGRPRKPRNVPQSQPLMQNVPCATASYSGRGRRSHDNFAATNHPYNIGYQSQVPTYQDQFYNT